MNLKLYNFFGVISFIPIWIFRGNLNYIEIAFVIVFFFLIPCLIHFYFVKVLLNKNKQFCNILLFYYLSLISVHCIDQNLGLLNMTPYLEKLEKQFEISNVNISHITIFCTFIISLIIFLFIFFLKKKGLIILSVFLLTTLIINILDYRKNISSFPKINVKNNKNINENLDYKNKKLVIILDGMSGINSLESSHHSGLEFKKKIKILFDKYQFAYYVNARSISDATIISIPSMLNFIYDEETILSYEKLRSKGIENTMIKKSKNYFVWVELLTNKFFDNKNNNNIVVFQTVSFDYCKHYKVIKCYQYNPFDRNNLYLEGFNNNFLSRSLSAYKNSLSIISKYLLRIGRQLRIADSFLDPRAQKAIFPYQLQKIENSLEIEKANLFFAHFLVPHTPYAWDKNCDYNGAIESKGKFFQSFFQTTEERVIHHNLERECVVYYLDIFLENLRTKEFWPDLEIYILSDHGARLLIKDDNYKSAIFAAKTRNILPGLKKDNIITNYLFYKFNN